ncbi:MAG: hypothetical protein QOE22_449 [Candidatus Parcubacteria bacterium]|jgi:hypothetical protein|nr:hypothetical protein [Candidatus Parcubacteria bacterium]
MHRNIFSVVLLACIFLVPSTAGAASKVRINLFTSSSAEILSGESVTLIWNVSGKPNCQLRDDTNNDGKLLRDNVGQYGELTLTPQKTTKYMLYCTQLKYKDGRSIDQGQVIYSDQETLKVTVKKTKRSLEIPNTGKPTCTLKAVDKSKNKVNGSVKLAWTSVAADYALLTVDYAHGFDIHQKKRYKPKGSLTHKPEQSATYRLNFFGKGGTAACEAQIDRKG